MGLMLFARIFPLLAILAFVGAGCAAMQPASADGRPQHREIIVTRMVYDGKGLPAPGAELRERPSQPGDHYTVLSMADDRLLESCDIAVSAGRHDFRKPFQAVYEWTGKGFEVGLQATAVLTHGLRGGVYSGSEALAALAFVFAPVAIGGVGGFVIGIGDGMVQTAVELRKFALNDNEQIMTCTLYDYDMRGRLLRMRMLGLDRKQELVRTTFEYEGFGKEPSRTTVESFVEGRQRDIW